MDKHLQSVIDEAGRVDISFNAVGIPGTKILGVPLVELDVEQFSLPITTYTTSYFVIARMADRRMVANQSGVIMTATTQHARMGIPLSGGYGPAMAAEEALTRVLSAELAPQGIRVVGLRPQAIPETGTLKEAFEVRAKLSGTSQAQIKSAPSSKICAFGVRDTWGRSLINTLTPASPLGSTSTRTRSRPPARAAGCAREPSGTGRAPLQERPPPVS